MGRGGTRLPTKQEDHEPKGGASTHWLARQDDPLIFARPLVELTKVVFDVAEEATAATTSAMAISSRPRRAKLPHRR